MTQLNPPPDWLREWATVAAKLAAAAYALFRIGRALLA